jgi:hypothetical protein
MDRISVNNIVGGAGALGKSSMHDFAGLFLSARFVDFGFYVFFFVFFFFFLPHQKNGSRATWDTNKI